jgi:hypothetical protein
MNGATAEPLENTIKNPINSMASNIGNNQYFFLFIKNLPNSFKKSIFTPV